MKNCLLLTVAALIFCAAPVFSQTNNSPETDTQLWHETKIYFPLLKKTDENGKKSDRLSFFVAGNLRFGQNVRHFIDERIGAGLDLTLTKNVSVSTSYLYRAGQPLKNRKEYEHRLRFDLNLEKKWKTFSIKDRNRIEHRIHHSRSDSTRYRNKIQLKIPIKKDGKELFAPFVADEPYYDFSKNKWNRNEFSAGISKKLPGKVSADFFYLLQTNDTQVLKTVHVFGVNLKFSAEDYFKFF